MPHFCRWQCRDSETVEIHHRGRGRRGELRAIIYSNIFEEKHRISKKTAHPGLHSLVDAANPAASSRGSGRCSATTDFRGL